MKLSFSRAYSKVLTHIRSYSDKSAQAYLNTVIPADRQGHLALVSISNNIHYNLALENYLAENVSLKNRSILLIWKSDKAVVYGRHQNPWIECNLKQAQNDGVRLARRYTGGGCVYHDLGNLNISFIVDRLKYNREFNLNLIKKALDKLNLKSNYSIYLSPRHDIFIKESPSKSQKHEDTTNVFKISGTASRLAKDYSYHHCTLLYESNLTNMSFLKSSIREDITSRATASVRSKCLNLKDCIDEPNFNIDQLVNMVCEEYWRVYSKDWSIQTLFNYVDPVCVKSLYEKSLEELESWQFQFGTTPKFQLNINIGEFKLDLTIQNGIISKYEIDNVEPLVRSGLDCLVNTKLRLDDINQVFNKFKLLEIDQKFYSNILDYFNKNLL